MVRVWGMDKQVSDVLGGLDRETKLALLRFVLVWNVVDTVRVAMGEPFSAEGVGRALVKVREDLVA
jgi:hypothetical protein